MNTTTRDQVIADEQKAVDRAYDCYAERLAEMTGTAAATAAASNKDGIANRLDTEEKAAAYDGLGGESLVTARVDAPDEPGSEPRPWYIGRRAVSDVRTRDTVVVLWTSPMATKWAAVQPQTPGDITLRRQLRCVQRVVEDYFDDIAPAVPVPVPAPVPPVLPAVPAPRQAGDDTAVQDSSVDEGAAVEGADTTAADRRPPARTPADLARRRRRPSLQPDDFLLRELQRSRGGRMRDIVETIRRDQMDLVTGSPSDILVVQGGPGTGKSAVGLHRVTWLVNNRHFPAQDILVIGPHQRFLDYVGQVLPTLGTRDVNVVQLSRLWDGEVLGADAPQARLVKSDERMAAVLQRRVEHECRPEAVDSLLTAPSFAGDEPAFTVTAGSTTLRIPRTEVHALFDEARSGEGAHRERRDRFRSLLVDRLLRELAALAPRRGADGTIRRSLERNRQVERLIDRAWPSPGAREALRSLYDSPELLRTCADGLLDAEEQATLHRPRAERAEDDPWTLDDRVCLEELRHLITGEPPRRYGHIVVDEAQDLTPMQARALRRRVARGGSMTVLGDLAQATGPYPYPGWDRLGTLLSDHGDWRVEELTTSYRVPAEIMAFVAPLARAVAPALPYPRAVRAAGADAVRTVATEPWKLLGDTVAQVVRLVGSNDGRTLRSVAVIVPDDSGWLEEIGRHLDAADGITQQEREAVSVLAARQVKGMEYDHVLVVEPATIADRGPSGLRQLYIALTRSTQSLTVLHTAPLPAVLTDTGGAPAEPQLRVPESGTESGSGTGTDSGTAPVPVAESGIPEIGSDVRVRVVGHTTGGNYRVEAISPPMDRPLLMAVRHGSAPPTAGAELDAWVLRHLSGVSFVTVDERGRRPISPTMAPRYAAALGIVAELADGSVPDDFRPRLSELKGMANRCLRLDQHDWLDVWRVLGSPDRSRLNALRDLAAHRVPAAGSPDLDRFRAELERSGWAEDLDKARRTIEARIHAATGPVTDDQPPVSRRENPEPSEPSETPPPSEPEEAEPMTTTTAAPAAPEKTESSTGLPQLLATSAAADRTCKTHEAVRFELKAALLRADRQPEPEHPVVDVACVTDEEHLLYEVLGAGLTSYADLRSGAARLREINHALAVGADRLCLVLAGPPAEEWAPATVHDVFGVHVLWRTPQQSWDGQDVAAALGGGPV
ncbi:MULTISPECIES: HelD family protein [Streptomyces]|uniref:HelD family protein n=1 Tax=Streptomyces TaxID=1883 RepID=UPI0004C90635|nr:MULTISPECIES: AAA family ATPase [Streptomyces]CAD5933289.1 DNA helicase [Streptomyces sp. KY75]CAD5988190.1 DNA helicase [Streptomyces sp. KY70]